MEQPPERTTSSPTTGGPSRLGSAYPATPSCTNIKMMQLRPILVPAEHPLPRVPEDEAGPDDRLRRELDEEHDLVDVHEYPGDRREAISLGGSREAEDDHGMEHRPGQDVEDRPQP